MREEEGKVVDGMGGVGRLWKGMGETGRKRHRCRRTKTFAFALQVPVKSGRGGKSEERRAGEGKGRTKGGERVMSGNVGRGWDEKEKWRWEWEWGKLAQTTKTHFYGHI
jgi:hypothetical protein